MGCVPPVVAKATGAEGKALAAVNSDFLQKGPLEVFFHFLWFHQPHHVVQAPGPSPQLPRLSGTQVLCSLLYFTVSTLESIIRDGWQCVFLKIRDRNVSFKSYFSDVPRSSLKREEVNSSCGTWMRMDQLCGTDSTRMVTSLSQHSRSRGQISMASCLA